MSTTKHSRVLGALLGVHAGDSLGATTEFMDWSQVKRRYPTGLRDIIGGGSFGWEAGAATDDTDLTRAVLLAYYDAEKYKREGPDKTNPNKGKDLLMTAAQHMLDWFTGNWPGRAKGTYPPDVGNATRGALSNLGSSGDPTRSGMGEGNAGNGSLMRCIATGLFQDDAKKLEEESIAISDITHRDSECALSCVVYNVMVSQLVNLQTAETAWEAGMEVVKRWLTKHKDGYRYKAAVQVERVMRIGRESIKLEDFAANGPKGARHWKTVMPHNASGYVLDSLLLAVAAMLDPRSLEDVLVDVVRVGKDTDTNGAIAGGLLGARDGVEAIPPRWRSKLQFQSEFNQIVDYMLHPSNAGDIPGSVLGA